MKKILLSLLFAAIFGVTSYAQVSVIVNKSVPDSKLTSSAVGNIYTLTTSKWNNGSKIVVFDQKSESSTKSSFYGFINKDGLSLKKEWMKKQLTGEAKAPEMLGSDEEVINKVASTPGAIGYVKSSNVNSNVKVVAEIK